MTVCIQLAQYFSSPFDLDVNAQKIENFLGRKHAEDTRPAGENGLILVLSHSYLTSPCLGWCLTSKDFHARIVQKINNLATLTARSNVFLLFGAPTLVDNKLFSAIYFLGEGIVIDKRLQSVLAPWQRGLFSPCRLHSGLSTAKPINHRHIKLCVPMGPEMLDENWIGVHKTHLARADTASLSITCHMDASPAPGALFSSRSPGPMAVQKKQSLREGLFVYSNALSTDGTYVWPGGSYVVGCGGEICIPYFEEGSYTLDSASSGCNKQVNCRTKSLYEALVFATRAFLQNNGFSSAVLGLSGGIDSSLVAAIAADALGREQVTGIMMRSPFTSDLSVQIAKDVARGLGIRYKDMDFSNIFLETALTCRSLFEEDARIKPVLEENVQARLRGLILMAFSNQTGALLLSTGNKSEVAVGYTTLYGDMCGSFSPIRDVYKTEVYELARWRNTNRPDVFRWEHAPTTGIFPESVFTRPATAELAAEQYDQDSLPDYGELDFILKGLLEEKQTRGDLIKRGASPESLERVLKLLAGSAHKRKQAAPGPRVTTACFGVDINDPITIPGHPREAPRG